MHSLRPGPVVIGCELRQHLFSGTPPHQDALPAAARSAENLHGAQRQPAGASQKPAQLVIGCAIGRRRRYTDFNGSTVKSCVVSTGSFWLDMHRNDGALGCGVNGLLCSCGPGLPPDIMFAHNIPGNAE